MPLLCCTVPIANSSVGSAITCFGCRAMNVTGESLDSYIWGGSTVHGRKKTDPASSVCVWLTYLVS